MLNDFRCMRDLRGFAGGAAESRFGDADNSPLFGGSGADEGALAPLLQPNEKPLILGLGDPESLGALFGKVKNCHVMVVDPSHGVIDSARDRVQRLSPQAEKTFQFMCHGLFSFLIQTSEKWDYVDLDLSRVNRLNPVGFQLGFWKALRRIVRPHGEVLVRLGDAFRNEGGSSHDLSFDDIQSFLSMIAELFPQYRLFPFGREWTIALRAQASAETRLGWDERPEGDWSLKERIVFELQSLRREVVPWSGDFGAMAHLLDADRNASALSHSRKSTDWLPLLERWNHLERRAPLRPTELLGCLGDGPFMKRFFENALQSDPTMAVLLARFMGSESARWALRADWFIEALAERALGGLERDELEWHVNNLLPHACALVVSPALTYSEHAFRLKSHLDLLSKAFQKR